MQRYNCHHTIRTQLENTFILIPRLPSIYYQAGNTYAFPALPDAQQILWINLLTHLRLVLFRFLVLILVLILVTLGFVHVHRRVFVHLHTMMCPPWILSRGRLHVLFLHTKSLSQLFTRGCTMGREAQVPRMSYRPV